MLSLTPAGPAAVAVLGAHCDDIAIGCGGTLLTLCRARPGQRVHAFVLTGGGTKREDEERAALAAFCPGAELSVTVLDLPDGRVPDHWGRAKDELSGWRAGVEADLVLCPAPHDVHQDHRALAQLAPQVFRDQLRLGYEILKWESDLAQPTVFQPIEPEVAHDKARLLDAHYPSQRDRDWFDAETFLGLARVRGVQTRARYAEAFHTDKIQLRLAGER
ncbi:LmbE family N-acetylglucosaminyl deacetylase [Crossiella equi]|uniref:LmbE family N-acetylglucosaminyl deacetylase n=1 Tax=Crossiella equi TaxID=130796 RepID=A0ABS5ABI7_9PSEU|nr:PIG-L family deacetylase [Crossiella equi]MBP2473941.1 LmbE family N-acetylglucosaminyl deacetylase [Crossiella equi]